MSIRVGINGFGRIGRQGLKALLESYPQDLEVVVINDITDVPKYERLLRYYYTVNSSSVVFIQSESFQSVLSAGRVISRGNLAALSTCSVVLPIVKSERPLYPCVAMAITSQPPNGLTPSASSPVSATRRMA